MPDPEFPFEAARDLVGIPRVLWSVERGHQRHSKKRLALITQIARTLKMAIRVAATHDPGTAPHRKAIVDAEGAVKMLEKVFVDMFGNTEPMPDLVRTAGLRVKGAWKPCRPGEREIKWAVGKQRG